MFNFTVKGSHSMSYVYDALTRVHIAPESTVSDIVPAEDMSLQSRELLKRLSQAGQSTGIMPSTCVYDALGRLIYAR